jgi:arginine/lysine/ornithine decarboxylase
MLFLLLGFAKLRGKKPLLAAGRNAHKSFLTAAALLDIGVDWLYPAENPSYLACNLQPEELEAYFQKAAQLPVAVYLTSPDYLGNLADIAALAEVCHRYGVLLAVDNAHGAYLKFLPKSLHPMDLGADICCDSAHKTLPVLTGGAYLHLSAKFDEAVGAEVKNALALFGSTSPSYLILQSLDAANVYLEGYPQKLEALLPQVEKLRNRLRQRGYRLWGNEPLKLTVDTKAYGYEGTDFADMLRSRNIEPEFADPDQVVLLLSAQADEKLLGQLEAALLAIEQKPPIKETCLPLQPPKKRLSIREAMLSPSEVLPAENCVGRILAVPTVGCPPAVPILVCGEEIDAHALRCFAYYGIHSCSVVK